MAGRGNGRGGRHLLRAHAPLLLLVGVAAACSGAPQPTPEPRPTRDASVEREVGIYTAAIHEVFDVPGLEIEGTVWLVELTDPNGPVAGKPGPKLAEDVVEGLVDELSEVRLRPVASFRDAFEGGHPRDEGVVVTVSPIRDQRGPAEVSANVYAGPGNASGSQLVVGLRNGEWRVIRVIGEWIT